MEPKANFVIVGIVAVVIIAGAFGFVYWFINSYKPASQKPLLVSMKGSVVGLTLGSGVTLNGIRIGEVSDIQLDSEDQRLVRIKAMVDSKVPISNDTKVRLDYTGFTGMATLALLGQSQTASIAPLSIDQRTKLPVLNGEASQLSNLVDSMQGLLGDIKSLLAENRTSITHIISNLDAVTTSLALSSKSGQLSATLENVKQSSQALRDISAKLSVQTPVITNKLQNTLDSANRAMVLFHNDPSSIIFGKHQDMPTYNGQ